MPLVGTKEMFERANKEGYAVGAFNVNDMEILQGIADAAKEENAPLILQVSAGARKYARPGYLVKLVEAAIEDTGLPIVLHLDHGEDFEICKACVDNGFSSVMIDASRFPLEENIKLTKQVVEYAHSKGVVVEAELGKLAGIEDDVNVSDADAKFTDPEEAAEFISKTGVDSLAVAIGTSHGAYKFKGDAKLDFERLEKIMKAIPAGYPLVLHGASSVPQELVEKCNKYGGRMPNAKGVPEDFLRKAAGMGVAKINIDSDLRLAMTATIREVFVKKPEEFDPRKYLGPARDAIKSVVQNKIKNVLGCSGKA
ncbi:MAG TPA: class II fructose-1,6-bisphosphate aldolase [Firmicutes bacterium]|nr:class II fructose-1,6-bisphosphate aldolase [Bacillota bacterium]